MTRWWRSLRLQALVLVVVLVAAPLLVLRVLGDADAERRTLLLAAVADAGSAIGTGLAGELGPLAPADIERLPAVLAHYAGGQRRIRVLLRPPGGNADGFFLLAAAPAIAPDEVDAERRQLRDLGVLPMAAEGCAAPRAGATLLGPLLLGAGSEVLTAVVAVAGVAGCWAVVIGTDEMRLRGVADPGPYWRRPEARAALAIYGLMAALVVLVFAGVWRDLRRMQNLAASEAAGLGFAEAASVPELSGLAGAFDDMVRRLRRGAEMLRQAAEANAHAFKGPIGIIRQALEPLRPSGGAALAPVDAALDRLDGLVRSARVLDSAAADLLEPELVRVDVSALAEAVVAGFGDGRVVGAIEPGLAVRAQADALETVLENLIENALGFSPAGGMVRVVLARAGGEAVLTVADDGPGVAPERIGRIFERYYSHRPDHTGRGRSGTHFGIGLWLVRQHVLLLGGSVAAENRAGGGFSMVVRLPLAV